MLLYHSVCLNFNHHLLINYSLSPEENFNVINFSTYLMMLKVETYEIHNFGIQFSPVNFRRRITRLVSYYALFE